MNLEPLFQMQKELDAHIEQQHPREEGEDRLAKKILALQVELGELANEWRGFKFWSNDQEPRKSVMVRRPHEDPNVLTAIIEYKNPLLEEYVDCLHFILSIGLEHKFDELFNVLAIEDIKLSSITLQFSELMRTVWEVYEEGNGGYYHEGLELFLSLGEMLGFTWEQVEEAYMAKNQVNHARQENGY